MSSLDQHRDADRGIDVKSPPSARGSFATLDRGADAALDRVEREDVVIVENASAASARGFTGADG